MSLLCFAQGCHFKYASIRGTFSQPLFAFLPPHTLVMHSSHGIQFVQLLCATSQTKSWQAQGPSILLQPARQTAAMESSMTAMEAETADSQQPVLADPVSSKSGMQASVEPVRHTDLQQRLPQDGQGSAKATVHESEADANSRRCMSSVSVASQAEPAHSVWSMSASSEASSSGIGVSETSSGCPAVTTPFMPHAIFPDAMASPLEHGVGSDAVSLFTVSLGGARFFPEADVHCSVTAEMGIPAFDLEKFVMDHIPRSMLHQHRLTDYAVELLGDGTSVDCQQVYCCNAFQEKQAAQHCASQKSVLLLIVAILKPTFVTINPTGCLRCTVLNVNVHVPSGTKCHPASIFCIEECEALHRLEHFLLPAFS